MEIKVQNFGNIADATVKVGGLTVIAGENDSGKSTIGKILFSLVKAFSRIEDDLKEHKESKVLAAVESIYFFMRKTIDLNTSKKLRDDFFPPLLLEQFNTHGDTTTYHKKQQIKELFDLGVINEHQFEFIDQKLDEIRQILHEDSDPDKARINTVRRAFYSEFKGEVVNKITNNTASITINDGMTTLLSMQWSKNGITDFRYEDEIQFEDATYVDSTTLLQFHNYIQAARTLFDAGNSRSASAMVPLHIKDLSRKLQNSYYIFDLLPDTDISKSKSIYDGDFFFDKETSQFVLSRHGYRINSSNVASGIKNLGVFDILVRSNHFNTKSLVILDEPELNLHPEWQISYAKAICEQSRNGNNVIVTTHSPYMVEALYFYSEFMKIKTNFYMTEVRENGSFFIDTTNNIPEIISKLAKPLERLHMEIDGDF